MIFNQLWIIDSKLYSCWHNKQLVGLVKLQVIRNDQNLVQFGLGNHVFTFIALCLSMTFLYIAVRVFLTKNEEYRWAMMSELWVLLLLWELKNMWQTLKTCDNWQTLRTVYGMLRDIGTFKNKMKKILTLKLLLNALYFFFSIGRCNYLKATSNFIVST